MVKINYRGYLINSIYEKTMFYSEEDLNSFTTKELERIKKNLDGKRLKKFEEKYNIKFKVKNDIMNQQKLRTLIHKYKIGVNRLGQLIYLDIEVSLRSILLCSEFYISKKKITDGFGNKDYLIKGFIDRWIFNKVYDKELINENQLPPQLEYLLEIDKKNKMILIKPKY